MAGWIGGIVAALAAVAPAAASTGLDFDRTFNAQDEAPRAHYEATYRLRGQDHRLEVWRDRERQIRRRTDDTIETYLVKQPDDVEWSMTVLDLKRRIRTDIDRTNLYRIGHFTDWFAMAHVLSRPQGAYTLTAIADPEPKVAAIGACRWYRLEQGGRSNRICWSPAQRVALVIIDPAGVVEWKVTRIDHGKLKPDVFSFDDRGYVRNDANRDIGAD